MTDPTRNVEYNPPTLLPFSHGSFRQAMAIILTGTILAVRNIIFVSGEYVSRLDGYPFGMSPMTWGMAAGLIICAGSGLYIMFDRWLGKFLIYRVLRWAALSFWLTVAIVAAYKFYNLIQSGAVVPDWSL